MRALVPAALLAAAPVQAGELQALIVTGSADRAAAEKLLEATKKKAEGLSKVLTFAVGFPKLAASAEVSGLKPGFFIVLAGFCADDALLAAVKALDAGAYAKPVQVDAAACPALADGWEVKSAEARGKDKRVLRGTLFQPRGEDSWLLYLALRDRSGAALAERAVAEEDVSGCIYGGEAEVAARGGALVVKTVDCAKPRGCPNPGLATTAVTFTPAEGRIDDALKVLVDPGYRGCAGE